MEPTKELIDQLYREKVRDAQKMPIAQKLVLGGDLFDAACEVALGGIRARNRGISPVEALEVLRKQLEFARRTETRL